MYLIIGHVSTTTWCHHQQLHYLEETTRIQTNVNTTSIQWRKWVWIKSWIMLKSVNTVKGREVQVTITCHLNTCKKILAPWLAREVLSVGLKWWICKASLMHSLKWESAVSKIRKQSGNDEVLHESHSSLWWAIGEGGMLCSRILVCKCLSVRPIYRAVGSFRHWNE